jgi:hypothetical protein
MAHLTSKRVFSLSNLENQVIDALRVTVEFFDADPNLKETRASEFPRGSVYGIVKAALDRAEEAYEADRIEEERLSTYVHRDSK